MLLPRARTLLWSLVLCLPLAVFGWLAAALCLISQEDYTPEPGSFTYYIGISSLVRHAPLVGALGKAEYFGTVGDGNKPPHGLVSYDVEFASIGPATHAFDAYLLGKGYSRTADDETPPPLLRHGAARSPCQVHGGFGPSRLRGSGAGLLGRARPCALPRHHGALRLIAARGPSRGRQHPLVQSRP